MIETKKLTDTTLKRIIKSDNTTLDVHITDVPENVISNGTVITDSVLANINYKDDNKIEFSMSNTDITPNPNKAILYVKNGKLYCAIDGYSPLEISSLSVSNLLPKTGITYACNNELKYFNINSGIKLFSTNTKVGAIPLRYEESDNINDATFIDFQDGNISAKINNQEKLKISENVELKNTNSNITLGTNSIAISNSVFNVEMNNQTVKIKKQNNTLFEVRSSGSIIIGNKTIEELINEKIYQYDLKILLSNQVSNKLYYNLNEANKEYTVHFSDTSSSNILMSITFDGTNIDNLGIFYKSATNSYYEIIQHYQEDEEDDDYIEIRKVTESGSFISNVYFRGIYYIYK